MSVSCRNLLCVKLATPALLCSVVMCLDVFSRTPQRIHAGLFRSSSSPQVGCISLNVTISCAVPAVGSFFPQTPNSRVCSVMLTLHHLLQNYRRLCSDNI